MDLEGPGSVGRAPAWRSRALHVLGLCGLWPSCAEGEWAA